MNLVKIFFLSESSSSANEFWWVCSESYIFLTISMVNLMVTFI